MVPGCGYYGAKRLNSSLLCCFSSWSCIGGTLMVVSMLYTLFLMIVWVPNSDHWIQTCDPNVICCQDDWCDADTNLPKEEFRDMYLDCVLGADPRYDWKYWENDHLEEGECRKMVGLVTTCQE